MGGEELLAKLDGTDFARQQIGKQQRIVQLRVSMAQKILSMGEIPVIYV